jgi:DNA-binding NtrC family response regulator
LERTRENKARTAKLLGINLRTIYRKMDEFNITSYKAR